MTAVLGISCHFHDAAAALVIDGHVVAAAEEERFTRIKHDSSFPRHAVRFCLDAGQIESNDLDYVVFYERPLRKFGRVLVTAAAQMPGSAASAGRSVRRWLTDKLWITSTIAARVNVPPSKIVFVDHHMAHAASALLAAPFTDAAVLTIDGVGEWSTATLGWGTAPLHGEASRLQLTHTMDFPHSLGLLYSAFTSYLGFEVNEGEFKVMGMAAYGRPRFREHLDRICRVHDDGSLTLDLRYFAFHRSDRAAFDDRLVEFLGAPPRDPSQPFEISGDDPCSRLARHYADVAASVQALCEDAVVAMARHAHSLYPSPNLAYAGGVALNGLANTALLERTPYSRLFIPPAPGDSGGALGAALYVSHVSLGRPRRYCCSQSYLGANYDDQIEEAVRDWGVPFSRHDRDSLVEVAADSISQGKVVAWYQGRFEWGPRALGNRSILADPGRPGMKELINSKIKFREQFRPFAPVILADEAHRYFDGPVEQDPARFMLLVLPVSEHTADTLGATTHFGTARVQTLYPGTNDLLTLLLQAMAARQGYPVLLNTSFNLRGEPIVATPVDALSTFQRSGLDLLVMGDYVISKR